MRIALVYNRESQRVINLFGLPNQEKYGKRNIRRIVDALRAGGHRVETFEGDKDLITQLEKFMPRVVKGERPGMVFNLSYGIQGQARYTHVPGMLEMLGLPYVGSGPLAHSLCLDKIVSKMLFVQNGVPTPEFAELEAAGFEMPPGLKFPLIVKPKNEAVSFGVRICRSEADLREAADVIFDKFQQPVLVERFISGREINVGLLGNQPPDVFPPAEILFGHGGPPIYTYEDKTRKSGRQIDVQCPADLAPEITERAQAIARRAFAVLGCYDCARVDMRLDNEGNLFVLELNSLPSLGAHGSYVEGAAKAGLDFAGLCNRLVDVACTRYFGTPQPPELSPRRATRGERVFQFITQRRAELERQVERWVKMRSRTSDPVGMASVAAELGDQLGKLAMTPCDALTDQRVVWTWQTNQGFQKGTLLIAHIDVPMDPAAAVQAFRREPEWIYGEGVGSSRAPLVSLLFALRALRQIRVLQRTPLGVLLYSDEGRDCRYSGQLIQQAAQQARNVLVLTPGNIGDQVVIYRRGERRYRLAASGTPVRLGRLAKKPELLAWMFDRLQACAALSSRKDRIGVSTLELQTQHLPTLLPHEANATLLVTYPDEAVGDRIEREMRALLDAAKGIQWRLETIARRPPMKQRRASERVARELKAVAEQWQIPLEREGSVWPSVAGLVPSATGVVCGVGPVGRDIYTPHEAVDRTSLIQRTLLLAQYLLQQVPRSANGDQPS
jgi:D-alanine-D-alanine ligase